MSLSNIVSKYCNEQVNIDSLAKYNGIDCTSSADCIPVGFPIRLPKHKLKQSDNILEGDYPYFIVMGEHQNAENQIGVLFHVQGSEKDRLLEELVKYNRLLHNDLVEVVANMYIAEKKNHCVYIPKDWPLTSRTITPEKIKYSLNNN